jgi:hypothetical protein
MYENLATDLHSNTDVPSMAAAVFIYVKCLYFYIFEHL